MGQEYQCWWRICQEIDKLKHNICETITFTEVSELTLISNNNCKRLIVSLLRKGNILSIYYDGEFL
jgi:hypothetical protein